MSTPAVIRARGPAIGSGMCISAIVKVLRVIRTRSAGAERLTTARMSGSREAATMTPAPPMEWPSTPTAEISGRAASHRTAADGVVRELRHVDRQRLRRAVAVAADVEDQAVEAGGVEIADVGEGSAAVGLPAVHDDDAGSRPARGAGIGRCRHEPARQSQVAGRDFDALIRQSKLIGRRLDRTAVRQADALPIPECELVGGTVGGHADRRRAQEETESASRSLLRRHEGRGRHPRQAVKRGG